MCQFAQEGSESVDHTYPPSYWIVMGILLRQVGDRLGWFRFLCHSLCQYPSTSSLFPVNCISPCNSLSFSLFWMLYSKYSGLLLYQKGTMDTLISYWAWKCMGATPLPLFLVFWDKVSLLCLHGLGTHYVESSNWLWTCDLLLSCLSDRLWAYTVHMTLLGNFLHSIRYIPNTQWKTITKYYYSDPKKSP